MLKKLTEEKHAEILESGISEFAALGLERASMKSIAARAGISVGVLYKYYEDKNAFFLACLRHSLGEMEQFLSRMIAKEDKPLNNARAIVELLQYYAREHGDYIRMYHQITGLAEFAEPLSREIEGFTSRLYSSYIAEAQKRGEVRKDVDPKAFAFFFDNLLMMLQFSYCCPYYRERFKLYCGEDIFENDAYAADQLLKFIESAFTLEQADIQHGKEVLS